MLDQEEKKRYNRHLILDEVGVQGQQKLKNAKVFVIGAGGLGCPILQYLAAAGVGQIGIIDFDTVDISNLQRQILFSINDIGENKAYIAAKKLRLLNPHLNIDVYQTKLSTKNAIQLFNQYDIIIDGSDNFSTRYLVNDAAVLTGKPLVYGSIYKFQGQIAVFNYKNGPSYRCLFPTPPKADSVKNCSEIGVIGVLPGIIGAQQANEALKIILEIGKPLSGKLLIYDALNAEYTTLTITRSETEIKKIFDLNNQNGGFANFNYDFFCGLEQTESEDTISLSELKNCIGSKEYQIIDLREDWEMPELQGSNIERIPISDLKKSIDHFSKEKKIILVCQTGIRSAQVKTLLEKEYHFDNIIELKGGLKNDDN